jgi:hypothetical protein
MLKMYEAAAGRTRVTGYVTGQATDSVKRQFEAALHILHFTIGATMPRTVSKQPSRKSRRIQR